MWFWWFMFVCKFNDTDSVNRCRKNDVEALSETNKWYLWISDETFHEEYGYLEICPCLLRKTLVENWLDHVVTICFGTNSVFT